VKDRLVDHLMGAIVVVWVGILVALALGGCHKTEHFKSDINAQEHAKTKWAETEVATKTAATAASSTKAKKRAKKVAWLRPDGTPWKVVQEDENATSHEALRTAETDSGFRSATGEEEAAKALREKQERDKASKPSASWLPRWCWVLLAAVVAGGVGLTIYRWGPGLWLRLVTRIRP
jgi:hypothetical protein